MKKPTNIGSETSVCLGYCSSAHIPNTMKYVCVCMDAWDEVGRGHGGCGVLNARGNHY